MGSNWSEYALGEIASFKYGKFLPKKDLVEAGYPVYSGYGVVGYLSTYQYEEEQLLIVCRGEGGTGDIKLSPPKCSITNLAIVISCNEKKVKKEFLYWTLKLADTHSLRTGSAQAQIVVNCLERFMVNIPDDLDEQNTIALILSSFNNKIELNRQINQTLEQIAQTIFKSWFVDFEPVKAKIAAKAAGRDPERAAMCAISGKLEPELDQLPPEQRQQLAATATLFPDELVESELGLIPVGWEVRKVESLLTRLSSKVRYSKDQVKPYGVTPVFEQGSGVLLGYHDGTAQFAATPEEPAFIFGDHTCVTHLACEPFDISQNVIPLKGSDRPTLWVYYAVKDKQEFQEYRRHWMELVAKDAVVPTAPISQTFAGRVSIIHSMLDSNVRQNLELMTLRDTLLPKLLSPGGHGVSRGAN